jgi:hypothetical protein
MAVGQKRQKLNCITVVEERDRQTWGLRLGYKEAKIEILFTEFERQRDREIETRIQGGKERS